MYLTQEMWNKFEARYGRPEVMSISQQISVGELSMIRSSQKYGRAHDVTFFITDDDGRVAVIHKPLHPPGVYRLPSGGIMPGESLTEGILREAREETGLVIEITRYILRVEALFHCHRESVFWTSHVITAKETGGQLDPIDKHEIADARYVTLEELAGELQTRLIESGQGLLNYRAQLTAKLLSLLSRD